MAEYQLVEEPCAYTKSGVMFVIYEQRDDGTWRKLSSWGDYRIARKRFKQAIRGTVVLESTADKLDHEHRFPWGWIFISSLAAFFGAQFNEIVSKITELIN